MSDFHYFLRPVDVSSGDSFDPDGRAPSGREAVIRWLTVRLPDAMKALPWRRILETSGVAAAVLVAIGTCSVWLLLGKAETTIANKHAAEGGSVLFPLVLEHGFFDGKVPTDLSAQTLFSGSLEGSRSRSANLSLAAIPTHLKQAVMAIEDHRFYDHSGIDWIRTAGAAWTGLTTLERPRGTSSITQQLARNVYLDRTEAWGRKMHEAAIAVLLERRLTKDEILERYLNFVPMGHHASFDIAGVGIASRVYFGKEASSLNLAEAAMLAGMIQAPSRLQPKLRPVQAKRRRHLVLSAMKRYGWIGEAEFAQADRAELTIGAPAANESGDFFVDAVGRELKAAGIDISRGARVRTTVDVRLQGIVEKAAALWGTRLEKRYKRLGVSPQIAIVALDPDSGAVRAIAGGRSFAESQLNHAFAKRAPGSLFKAFVYAAALQSSMLSGEARFSPETLIDDSPLEMTWRGESYTPGNFHDTYRGIISLQEALNVSANSAAVRLAGEVGYQPIARMARTAGLKGTEATPSAALGSYEATPLDVAGAYAVFANGGFAVEPHTVESVVSGGGDVLHSAPTGKTHLLDPRAAYITAKMLEGVMVSGTASRARSLGVMQPAGGKTGTTRDSWFAGFTSGLVCVVWVGFDDHRDSGLTGADGALPIWADVMRQAAGLQPYAAAKDFRKPYGVDAYLEAARLRQEVVTAVQ